MAYPRANVFRGDNACSLPARPSRPARLRSTSRAGARSSRSRSRVSELRARSRAAPAPRASAARAVSSRSRSSRSSGTTSRAAAVGVDARTSAAWSQSGVSCSCPTAETTGTSHSATARITRSSLNGRRSSKLPPPRVSTITSTSGSRASVCNVAAIAAGAACPWTYVCATRRFAAGKRAWTAVTKSRLAAASLPVRTPIRRGSTGSGRLRSGAKRPSAASFRFRRSRPARMAPRPRGSIESARSWNTPRAS